jgi:two-component sensor histidine kinase
MIVPIPRGAAGGQDVCPYQLGSVPHELTTNAAEYGALSIGQGLVHVTWQIEADNLLLRWEGPRIEKTPTSEGLGSTLVRRTTSVSFAGSSTTSGSRGVSIPMERKRVRMACNYQQ